MFNYTEVGGFLVYFCFLLFFFLARGNITVCGEFNFVTDPEAAYVVLNEYTCPMYIAAWEFAFRSSLPWVRHLILLWVHIKGRFGHGQSSAFHQRIRNHVQFGLRRT